MFTEEEMKVISLLGEDGFDEHFFCAITPSPVRRVFLYLFAERYEIRRKGATLRFYLQVVRDWLSWSGADVVYTHFPQDTHRDHVYLAQAVIPAARMCQALLFFETPSTQQFSPTLYLPAHDGLDDMKIAAIAKHESQVSRLACDLNLLDWARGLMTHRGYEFRTGPVEAYAVHKMNWGAWLS